MGLANVPWDGTRLSNVPWEWGQCALGTIQCALGIGLAYVLCKWD